MPDDLPTPSTAITYPRNVKRWALLVGISNYRDPSLTLKHAADDARALANFLQTPEGGEFIVLPPCVDQDATSAAITRGLRSKLADAVVDDLVLVYVACHGAADPKRPENFYFLPWETDPMDIAGTGLPMRELLESISENVSARRVIVLLDTCHAAAAADGARGNDSLKPFLDDAQRVADASDTTAVAVSPVGRYLRSLQRTNDFLVVFGSARQAEVALEKDELQAGVFTHFLLKGVREGAVANARGEVTLGALADYVSRCVKDYTGGRQTPEVALQRGEWRNAPMAITAGHLADDHRAVGLTQLTLAREHRERRYARDAARSFAEARKTRAFVGLAPDDLPLRQAEALILAGAEDDLHGALDALVGIENAPDPAVRAGGLYLRAVAQWRDQRFDDAHATLATLQALTPGDPRAEAWESPVGQRRALLVYHEASWRRTSAARSITARLRDAFESVCGFPAINIKVLAGTTVTRDAVLTALRTLRADTGHDDDVVVYISALADVGGDDTKYLAFGDNSWLGVDELHDILKDMPTRKTLLLLDALVRQSLVDRINEAKRYSAMLATEPGHQAYNTTADESVGVFSLALLEQLRTPTAPDDAALHERIAAAVAARADGNRASQDASYAQRPVRIGFESRVLLGAVPGGVAMRWSDLFRRTFAWTSSRDDSKTLRNQFEMFNNHARGAAPEVYQGFARALLEVGALDAAERCLRIAREATPPSAPNAAEIDLLTARTLLILRRYEEAIDVLDALVLSADSPRRAMIDEARRQLVTAAANPPRALLVDGVGGDDAVAALRTVLTKHMRLRDEHVMVLSGDDARGERWAAELQSLAARTEAATLFCMRAPSATSGDEPAAGFEDVAEATRDAEQMFVALSRNVLPLVEKGSTTAPTRLGRVAIYTRDPFNTLAQSLASGITHETCAWLLSRVESASSDEALHLPDVTELDAPVVLNVPTGSVPLRVRRLLVSDAELRAERCLLWAEQVHCERARGALERRASRLGVMDDADGLYLGLLLEFAGDAERAQEALSSFITQPGADAELVVHARLHRGRIRLDRKSDFFGAVDDLRSDIPSHTGTMHLQLGRALALLSRWLRRTDTDPEGAWRRLLEQALLKTGGPRDASARDVRDSGWGDMWRLSASDA